jgi:transcription antitermination factor NusG
MAFWAVCQCEASREHVAAQFLQQAEFKIYLPKILCKTAARSRVVPLFPGYLFVEVIDRWYQIRWTTGILRVLMTNSDQPASVSDELMKAIRRREDDQGLVKLPKPRGLVRGDAVRITRGSFEGQLAVFQGMVGAARISVLLDLMGRKVPVKIATRDVEPVSASCNRRSIG